MIAGDYLPIPASAEYGVIHQAQCKSTIFPDELNWPDFAAVEIPSSAEQTSFQERWEQLDAPVVNNAARGAQATAGAKRFPCSRCEKVISHIQSFFDSAYW